MNTVARNIRALAKRERISLRQLGIYADVSHSMLYQVLRGQSSPTTDWLDRIAEVLKVEAYTLVRKGAR